MTPQMSQRQKQKDDSLADTETEKISVSGQMELQGKSMTVVKIWTIPEGLSCSFGPKGEDWD